MWIVFGTGVKATRVPGGARVERQCGSCHEVATFYEKHVTSTFRLYFVDVFDYKRHRVMACGCCGACYATDELGVASTAGEEDKDTLGALEQGASRAATRVGDYAERAADVLENGINSLFGSDAPRARSASSTSPRPPPAKRQEAPPPRDEDEEIDPLEDPLEARFRELERKAGLRFK